MRRWCWRRKRRAGKQVSQSINVGCRLITSPDPRVRASCWGTRLVTCGARQMGPPATSTGRSGADVGGLAHHEPPNGVCVE